MRGRNRESREEPRRSDRILTIASLTSALLIIVLVLNSWAATSAFRRLGEDDLELVRLAGRIVHLDEVLTMSARMAASTGSEEWAVRYRIAEPELDRAIQAAIELAPEAESTAVQLTDQANRALVGLEQECLLAVREGRFDEARAIVFSGEYERLKDEYRRGVDSMIKRFNERTDRSMNEARIGAITGGIVALLGVGASFTALLIGVRRSRREERLRDELNVAMRRSTMGRLAASLAHELNQPLGAIVHYAGAIQAMTETMDDHEPLRKTAAGLATQAERAGTIVLRIRDFAKRSVPRREQVFLTDVVRDAVSLVTPEARQAQVEIETWFARSMPPVIADTIQLQQVLVNLLINAIEASTEGGRISIRALTTEGRINIVVRDDGVGISPEHERKIFEAFFTTKSDGLGLGLAISRDIVEGLGGRLTCKASTDGTEFQVSLPDMTS